MNELAWFISGFMACFLSLNAFIIAGVGFKMWKEISEENKK